MKPLHNYIWVEVEKTYEDSTIINGKEIYINPTYNPELNTRQHGIVYSISRNINNIKVGDKVYCHHFLITDEKRVNFIKDKLIYNIREPFVYATVRKGKLKMLNNWVFVKQTEELEENCKTESGIWIKPEPEEIELHGTLKYINKELKEQGVKINDKIIFSKDSEYKMNIEGKELMRMRNEDVLAVYNG